MRLGIADHFGWAIAVTATADHDDAHRRDGAPGALITEVRSASHRGVRGATVVAPS